MQTIQQYLNTLKANGLSNSVVKNTKVALEQLNEFKPLDECDSDDITSFIVSMQDKFKSSTIQVKKINIKQYFKAQGKAELVEHIKIKKSHHELDSSELLSVDDVNNLIEVTASPKYKALWAVLWETGARISEVLGIDRNKDLIEHSHGYEVKLYASKTAQSTGKGYRRMLLIESAPYIRNYILELNSTDSRLFPIVYESSIYAIKKVGKAIGRPEIYPHLFRHSKATQLVKDGVQESLIRKQLGWTGDSEMISKYIHLNDDDLIENQLQMAGIKKDESEKIKVQLVKPEKSMFDKFQESNNEQNEKMAQLEEQNKALLEKMVSLEMVQTLMQDNLNMKPLLETQMMLHPEEFTADEPIPTPTITESVDVKDAVQNFDLNREKAEKEYRASLKEAENNKNAS